MLRVAIFDDVVAARRETFNIPGLAVDVFAHADRCVDDCSTGYDVVFMDFHMGPGRKTGDNAVKDLREAGFSGRIVAMSSDPAANAAMKKAGAQEALGKKAHMRSYLVHLGAQHLRGRMPARGA